MTRRHELRCYDYVNRPHEEVRQALTADALGIFGRATHSAAARASDLGTALRVRIGALELVADVEIQITAIADARSPDDQAAMRLDLTWKSRRRPGLFPAMAGALWVYALAPSETQIEFIGTYDPPLGLVGEAIDAVVMRRIAEASVQRFVSDVASFLRVDVPAPPGLGSTAALVDRPV